MDGKVYLARRMNLLGESRRNSLGEPQGNLLTSGAEPDKLFPFSDTDPVILFILLLIFSHRFSEDTLLTFTLFIQKVVRQNDNHSIT